MTPQPDQTDPTILDLLDRDPLRAAWIRAHPGEWAAWERKWAPGWTFLANAARPGGGDWVGATPGEPLGSPDRATRALLELLALKLADAIELGSVSPYALERINQALLAAHDRGLEAYRCAHDPDALHPRTTYRAWLLRKQERLRAWQAREARLRAEAVAGKPEGAQ